MRDIFLLAVFPILIYFIFRRPFIGASLWIWSAMFFPNGWVWGIASSIRFNLVIAAATITSFIFKKNKDKIHFSNISFIILLFFIWTTISSALTLSNPSFVWLEWSFFLKIVIFYFICTFTITSKHHLYVFIWAVALSSAFFGMGEGLKYIATFGGHKVEGIQGSKLADNNQLALALNMTIPLLFFLLTQIKHKLLRIGLSVSIGLCIIAIIGSFSRGGLLALLVIAIYFFLQSKRKLLFSMLLIIVSISVVNFAPEKWFNRMDTISTASEDSSFLGRVVAWKQATLMANDNLFFGAGFKAGQSPILWSMYEQDFYKLDFIIDTSHYKAPFPKAAHSIYFQVLGDQGYIGLLIFLSILLLIYLKLNWVISVAKDEWLINLAKMLKVSHIAYCFGGAALSLPYFDLAFAIYAMTHCLAILTIKTEEKNKHS